MWQWNIKLHIWLELLFFLLSVMTLWNVRTVNTRWYFLNFITITNAYPSKNFTRKQCPNPVESVLLHKFLRFLPAILWIHPFSSPVSWPLDDLYPPVFLCTYSSSIFSAYHTRPAENRKEKVCYFLSLYDTISVDNRQIPSASPEDNGHLPALKKIIIKILK